MYFSLLRIGELTTGPHVIKVTDVRIIDNKQKILFILHSSKTHGQYTNPQLVKISNHLQNQQRQPRLDCRKRVSFCPYQLLCNYIAMHPRYLNKYEQFFVFGDRSPVKPAQMLSTLRHILKMCGYDDKAFSVHSFRSGRAGDLLCLGVSVETIKKLGRWKSNVVYTYLCNN